MVKFVYVVGWLIIMFLVFEFHHKVTSWLDQELNEKFDDQLDVGSSHLFSNYYQMTEVTNVGLFVEKTFYPETKQITKYYTFSNGEMTYKHGYAKEWWDNGDLRFEGNYKDDQREGEWKFYYKNLDERTVAKGNYLNGEKNGLWLTHNEKGFLVSEITFKNGKRDGIYKIFSSEGKLLVKGVYENEEQIQEEVLDDQSKFGDKEMEKIEEYPMFKGCEEFSDKEKRKECSDKELLMFINKTIEYPLNSRMNGVEGRTITKFLVDEHGRISEVNVIRGVCDDIKKEIEMVIKKMPEWNPGTKNGKPVEVWFTLPILFRFQD